MKAFTGWSALLFLVAGCRMQPESTEPNGVLSGRVLIESGGDAMPGRGPEVPKPALGQDIELREADRDTLVRMLRSDDEDGSFRTDLPAGRYRIVVPRHLPPGVGLSRPSAEAVIEIMPGEETTVELRIDTGIR